MTIPASIFGLLDSALARGLFYVAAVFAGVGVTLIILGRPGRAKLKAYLVRQKLQLTMLHSNLTKTHYTLAGVKYRLPEQAVVDEFFQETSDLRAIIVAAVDGAAQSLDLKMYNFTDPVLADAFLRAFGRGVAVRIYLDRANASQRTSQARRLVASGLTVDDHVRISNCSSIAHDKLLIVDGATVYGGSFNYTTNAEKNNRENISKTDSAAVAAQYAENFEQDWGEVNEKLTAALDSPLPAKG